MTVQTWIANELCFTAQNTYENPFEEEPREGSEKEPETVSLQAERAPYECDLVPFVEWAGELRCDAG